MTEAIVRKADAQDAAALRDIAERTFRDTFAEVNTAEDMSAHVAAAYRIEVQRAELAAADIATLFIEQDGVVAGFAQLRRGHRPACVTAPDIIELWRFYIDRLWIGRGFAQRLMAAVLAEAEKFGATTLWLGVWEHNPRAIAFYRKCGFREVGAHDFRLGQDLQTDLIMQRELPVSR